MRGELRETLADARRTIDRPGMSRGFVTDGRMMSTLEHDGNRLRWFREQPDPPRQPAAGRAGLPPVDAPLPQANAPVPQAFVSARRPPQRHLEPLVIDLARWLSGVAEFLATVTAVSLVVAAVTLVRKARRVLIEFADRPVDPLTVACVACILFAASGIWYAATLTGYIELNWYSQSPRRPHRDPLRPLVLDRHAGVVAAGDRRPAGRVSAAGDRRLDLQCGRLRSTVSSDLCI